MKRDVSARFEIIPGYWDRKWIFFGERKWVRPIHRFDGYIGNKRFSRELPDDKYHRILDEQATTPTIIMVVAERRTIWWAFRSEVYYHSDDEQDPEVIKGLILQKWQRDERRRERAIETARRDAEHDC